MRYGSLKSDAKVQKINEPTAVLNIKILKDRKIYEKRTVKR